MSGQKTEKATPKRRRDARKKGQVAKSTEINAAVILLLIYLGFKFFGGTLAKNIGLMFAEFYSEEYFNTTDNMATNASLIYFTSLKYFIVICGPLFLFAVVGALATNYFQVGFLAVPLSMKFDKVNPFSGFKRIFSTRTAVEFIKSIVKMFIVGLVVYNEFKNNFFVIPNLVYANAVQGGSEIWSSIMRILWKTALTYLIFGVFDYAYQRWEYEKSLKMSKDEIKQEYKQYEGDPQVKAKIREIQRHISMRRMMQNLKNADVVITNPTHFAVALLYDEKKNSAPTVVAKGKDYIALKIKEKAKEYKIHIVEDKPLARTLYKTTDIDQAIPEELYQAVAQILAVVYRMKKK